MIYALHHAVALALAGLAAAYLPRASWMYQHPRLAIALWQATGATIVIALVSGLLALGLAPYGQGVLPGLVSFTAAPAHPLPAAAITAGLALACGLLAHQARCAIRVGRLRARHRDLLALIAQDGGDALMVDHPLALAYCLPGRERHVVVSTGACQLLTASELCAVLAHEEAHLRERHHLVLGPFTALAQMFPRWRSLRRAVTDVKLLVEMRADDYAVRRHSRDALVGALEKFHSQGTGSAPAGALAAATSPLRSRIDRLHHSGSRPRRVLPIVVTMAVVTVLATPLSLLLTPL